MSCFSSANSSETTIAFGKQVACGTPQAALQVLRTTGSQLEFTAQSVESAEITNNRRVQDLIRTTADAGGSISGEFSYSTFWQLMQSALRSPTPFDGAGTVVKDGKTESFYTIEKNTPYGGTNNYTLFTDMIVNTMTINLPTSGPVTCEFTFVGLSEPTVGTTPIDASYTAATTVPVYNSNYHVNYIKVDGVSTYRVETLGITVDNQVNPERAIGEVVAGGAAIGKVKVTGPISFYFTNNDLYNVFLQDQNFAIEVQMDDKTGATNGNQTTIKIPKAKFSNLSAPIQGNNGSIIVSGTYEGLADVTSDSVINIACLAAAP